VEETRGGCWGDLAEMAVAISSGWFPPRADVYQHDIIRPSSAPALPEHRESFGYEEIGERTRWWRRAPLVLRGRRLRSHPVRECSVLSSLVGSLEDLESGITYGPSGHSEFLFCAPKRLRCQAVVDPISF
jgi:hypothetical protein